MSSSVHLNPGILSWCRSEDTKLVVDARLVTEEPTDVSSVIRRGL